MAGTLSAVRRAAAAVLAVVTIGCGAGLGPAPRPFRFEADSFSFINESHWVYVADPVTGERVLTPQPVYLALHCAGVVRAARQFLVHARFDPEAPALDAAANLELARAVLARDPRTTVPREPPIVIPGYPDLRRFSAAHEAALKEELLRDWRSVLPRGDWRIVVPFSPSSQARTAEGLLREVRAGTPALVRVFRFPVMTINHAVLLFAAGERDGDIEFAAYDPNDMRAPITVRFDRAGKQFVFPRNHYFEGGPVQIYEIYAGLLS